MNYQTEQEWRDAINAAGGDEKAQLQQAYQKWQDYGGENQIALPEDFKAPAGGPKQLKVPAGESQAKAISDYLKTQLPEVKANYGANDRTSYESEKARLQKLQQSTVASASDKAKAKYLEADLDAHFKPQAQQWYTDDIRNAGNEQDAAAAQQKLSALKDVSTDTTQQRINDIIAGGNSFGSAGDAADNAQWATGAGGMGGMFLDQVANDWNNMGLGEAYDKVGDQILSNGVTNRAGQLAYFDQGTNRALSGLTDANNKATASTQAAIDTLTKSGQYTKDQINSIIQDLQAKQKSTDAQSQQALGGVKDAYGKFGTERDAATNEYNAALDPLGQKLDARGYTGISTSADDVNRLLSSYGKLEDQATHGGDQLRDVYAKDMELAGPGLSDSDRALLELANRKSAQQAASFNDANMRRLRAAGNLSGGAQLAANQMNAADLGDTRLNGILSALANVDSRRQGALNAAGSVAGSLATTGNQAAANLMTGAQQIRTGDDAMAQFNKDQEGITQRFQDTYAQNEMDRLARLAQQKEDTVLSKTSGDFDAAQKLNTTTQDTLDKIFGRASSTADKSLTADQNKYLIDEGIADKTITGANNEANRAANSTGANLTAVNNKTTLLGDQSKDEEDDLKYKLGLLADKTNLASKGVTV